ncbi:marine proteobacterial sortase target protein [Bowmanella dokdonensis]|uniref:Marine proteobacterial sortase target protein n=1 Tax=Bowmanella dokdonensis TaxID=751969 RepID=A0A939DMZ0_9ALTE|nr:marine proteobacterial sortase target protein [Bowmanella dokdonensis]MBN7825753.1 marine proteobacterial sortase target protein [Bowmanella dokdonensis]
MAPLLSYAVRPAVFRWLHLAPLLLCLGALFAQAQQAEEELLPLDDLSHVRQGSLALASPAWQGLKLSPAVATRVHMQVTGLVARVRVEQRFTNPSDQWVNGTYLFPLPEQTAVDSLRLVVGERVIEGQIQPRDTARALYQQAKREGKKASLVSQQRPNLFTNQVANIGPGETLRIELEYQQIVPYQGGQFSLRFPMTLTPRYMPGQPLKVQFNSLGWAQDRDQVPDASLISPPLKHPDAPPGAVALKVEILAGMPLEGIVSPYHRVQIAEQADHHYQVRLQETEAANRDFVLNWRPRADSRPTAALFSQVQGNEQYGLLMLMPPSSEQPQVQAREVVFVLDTSGSMASASILQAKAALAMGIRDLSPLDYFNLIEFSSQARALWREPQGVNADSVAEALDFIDGLDAEGGTEMAAALALALDDRRQTGLLRQVVFITDGAVGNEEALMTYIRRHLGQSRLFTVGIGAAPNSYFMTEAAEAGRGTFTFIGDLGQVQGSMQQLLDKLRYPALTEVFAQFGGKVESYPSVLPDLYLGEPVMVSFRQQAGSGQVKLGGVYDGLPWAVSLPLEPQAEASGLDKLWARHKIAQLSRERRQGDNPEYYNRQIERVAMRHQIVSEFTSLVALDVTPSRPAREPAADRAVPNAVPQGLDTQRVFGGLPVGATSLRQHLLIALLLLAMCLPFWMLRYD